MNFPPRSTRSQATRSSGFSLVEVLAAVGIIGIIAFLALPNIVAIKRDSELNLAISRAEAVNMAVASYIQANGRDTAVTGWAALADEEARYDALSAYLAFAPSSFSDYVPGGFDIDIPDDLSSLSKAGLSYDSGDSIAY